MSTAEKTGGSRSSRFTVAGGGERATRECVEGCAQPE